MTMDFTNLFGYKHESHARFLKISVAINSFAPVFFNILME